MIIKSEVLYAVINEGRLETVKAKHAGREAGIDNLSKNDPSGNNKYLDWMAKAVFTQESPPKHVIEAVNYFHNNVVRFPQKDINQYQTLKDLLGAIEVAKAKISKKEVKESGVEKIYEDNDIIVIHPKTHAASCKYGSNTRWCVTMKNDPSYFRSYSERGPLFFFIDKRRLPNEPGAPRQRYWKVAASYMMQNCPARVNNFVGAKDGKNKLIEGVKHCISNFNNTNIINFHNASDTYVTKKTVEKYLPNFSVVMTAINNYIIEEYSRYYDLYESYMKEFSEYNKAYSEWKKYRQSKDVFTQVGVTIPKMSTELVMLIKTLDPEFDISKLQELITGVNWQEKAQTMMKRFKDEPEPKKPTTQEPKNISWYDRELDRKLDDERRKNR